MQCDLNGYMLESSHGTTLREPEPPCHEAACAVVRFDVRDQHEVRASGSPAQTADMTRVSLLGNGSLREHASLD